MLSNSTRKVLWVEIIETKCWLQFKKKNIASFIIIFGTLSFIMRKMQAVVPAAGRYRHCADFCVVCQRGMCYTECRLVSPPAARSAADVGWAYKMLVFFLILTF